MSAASGIGVSQELKEVFSTVQQSDHIRFVKISISQEQLVPDTTVEKTGSLEDDLEQLQGLLEGSTPAYILAHLDDQQSWLAISYVPDTAPVRAKMLYASTRNSLAKSLGATFADSLFANSKADLTPAAYAAHKAHLAAPAPMTEEEKIKQDVLLAESRAGGSEGYEGSRARRTHIGGTVGLAWSDEAEAALKELDASEGSYAVVLSIDPPSETLVLKSSSALEPSQFASAVPSSEPSYTFYAWANAHSSSGQRDIVFIYSCPSSSPIKHRMLYSSGSNAVVQVAKGYITSATLSPRRIETSDPSELNEEILKAHLGYNNASGGTSTGGDNKPFARPRGPGRKR